MFKRGDIVWGKLKTYPWWPAIVLNPKDCGRDKVGRNKFWIFWFGDHKVTQVKCSQILDFQKHFAEKCVPKMGKFLKSAIEEVLIIFATRCNIKKRDSSSLFEWAKKDFKGKLCLPSVDSKPLDLPDIVKNALQKKAFKPKCRSTSEEDSEEEIVNLLARISKGLESLEDICVMCCKSDNSVVIEHPLFIGGVCQDCRRFLTKIRKSPKGQMNDFCILCGQGGNLVYCCDSSCMCAYCEICLDYMTPKGTFQILKDIDWRCYLCVPNLDDSCLIKRRELCLAVDPPTRPAEKSPICVLGLTDEVSSILMKKMIAVDSSSYIPPEASSEKWHNYSRKEIENIDPDFIYDSFFVSSTAADKEESLESLYVLYYHFLYRLITARIKKPCVFFMFVCDGEIVDQLFKERVKRFLQVNLTEVILSKKKVCLWSNLPAIKGIKDNMYRMKKSRGTKFIEDVLNKFLEPLKDYFKQQ